MKAEDSFTITVFAVLIALLVFTVYMFVTDQIELYFFLAVYVILGLLFLGLVLYVVFGTYYAVKQKDEIHYDSGMTLDDVTEVDREMEKQ
jgi:amino acid permease